ncbi:DUF4383 domain-containing protein [Kineococcus gynurae]|uniref:DUF4383 domain-containing protein n=1 Tax=Kineococcus gynurae TaxID=452979 RepID=A0ABV5LRZ5_9ACTN
MSHPAAIEAPAPPSGGIITSFARLVGGATFLYGVLGVIPGIVTNYDQLGFFHSGATLFGLFTTSILSSALLMTFGLIVLSFAANPKQGHKCVVWLGLAYLVAGIAGAGLVVNSPSPVLAVNPAVNWLHIVLGLGILVVSKGVKDKYQSSKGVF